MNLRSGATLVAVGLLLAMLMYMAYVVRTALLLIFVSIIFAIIFSPSVEWVQHLRFGRWSPGRGISILLLLSVAVIGISVFLAFAVPPIARDSQQLTQDLPQNLATLKDRVRELPFGNTLANKLNGNATRDWLQTAIQHAFALFQSLISGVTALLTIVLMAAYFILDGKSAFRWALSLVPAERRRRLATTALHSAERMQRWLYGQFLLMLILGSSSAVVFGLLGIRYFYALAVFAGLANFVPILGPIATVVVASVVAALDSWTKAIGVVIFYLVYQQVENGYLTPKIMKSAVGLPGATVIVALTIGGSLAGLLGAIVAVPTAALIATIIDEYVVQDQKKPEAAQQPRAA